MTTIEGNKLIAEFMGYDYHKGLFIHRDAETPIGNTIKPDELQYHSSWDWLMPVVEKIEQMDGHFTIGTNKVECQYSQFKGSSRTGLGYTKIQVVWEVIVEFIKAYNTQTTTPSLPGDNNKK